MEKVLRNVVYGQLAVNVAVLGIFGPLLLVAGIAIGIYTGDFINILSILGFLFTIYALVGYIVYKTDLPEKIGVFAPFIKR